MTIHIHRLEGLFIQIMGNIVTPDQGLLPLPAYGLATTPYPWWLNLALAIWALLALLCCWLLLLLYLLRYCCKWWRHRQYAADRKSFRERLFGSRAAKNQHFATAPVPLVPPYAVSDGNEIAFRNIYEHRSAPYATAANRAYESGSESDSVRLAGVTENVETNIHRNITKNFYINEEQNYFVQKDPAIATNTILHDQEIQMLPAPTVTTINMAAERIADNPNWENVNSKEDLDNKKPKPAAAELITTDPSLLQQNVKYEKPPDIFTHRPPTPPTQNQKLGARASASSDDGSTTSEMSGHDSESIYETIRVFTPKKQLLPPLEDEDEYQNAGIDEVEIEIKDLIGLQKANPKSSDPYDDILSSTNMPRRNLTPRVSSSISSSSTLNNLIPLNAPQEEEKEETVTETIKTQQIQTTFHQIGQNLVDSAFFIPLPSSSSSHTHQGSDEQKIMVPISTSAIRYEEKPALKHF